MSNTPLLGPLLVDLEAETLSAREISLLKHPLVGGVIFFSRNYQSPGQLLDLVKSIRSQRPELLLSVDQEGGRVQRFREGFTRLPAPGTYAGIAKRFGLTLEEVSSQMGLLMAYELRQFDIDFSFAPVADIDYGHNQVIADRAFGNMPGMAGSGACSYFAGMQQAGMAGVAKHFPGHGWVKEDTHLEVARDSRSATQLMEDLLPFKMLLAAGVQGVMPAHVIYPAWDDKPAVQSVQLIERMLRQEMGFEGCVISDDLSMTGAAEGASVKQRVTAAVKAGCDLVMCCNSPEALGQVVDTLELMDPAVLMSDVQCRRRAIMRAKAIDINTLRALSERARELAGG